MQVHVIAAQIVTAAGNTVGAGVSVKRIIAARFASRVVLIRRRYPGCIRSQVHVLQAQTMTHFMQRH